MRANQCVRVPCHYDMWARGETTAYFIRSYPARTGADKGRTIAVLKGWRSGKKFRVWQDELEEL